MNKFSLLAFAALLTVTVSCNKINLNYEEKTARQDSEALSERTSLINQAIAVRQSFSDLTKANSIRVKSITPITDLQCAKNLTRSSTNTPNIYVVNFENDNGFVILADDTLVENNILALSDNGEITSNDNNEGLSMFFEDATKYLASSSNYIKPPAGNGFLDYPRQPSNWGRITSNSKVWIYKGLYRKEHIKPMVNVNWGQYDPYNKALQYSNYATGCLPTALVMIMSYYQQPTKIVYDNYEKTSYMINWQKAIYDKDIVGANIHHLMHHVAVPTRLHANHGITTPARASNIRRTLSYYEYSMKGTLSETFNDEIAIANLSSKKPIIVTGGVQTSGIHAWVIDGYILGTSNVTVTDYMDAAGTPVGQRILIRPRPFPIYYYHCNWGGNGKSNGYFASFKTDEGAIYDSENQMTNKYDFSTNRKMVYDICY